MKEIGEVKQKTVKIRDNRGRLVPKVVDGHAEKKITHASVWRVTRFALGGAFGRDRDRKLVVGLVAPDQIVLRPKGTRQEVRINIDDVYRIALQRKANAELLEKARERKAKKQIQRESRAIRRGDKRISDEAKRNKGKD